MTLSLGSILWQSICDTVPGKYSEEYSVTLSLQSILRQSICDTVPGKYSAKYSEAIHLRYCDTVLPANVALLSKAFLQIKKVYSFRPVRNKLQILRYIVKF